LIAEIANWRGCAVSVKAPVAAPVKTPVAAPVETPVEALVAAGEKIDG